MLYATYEQARIANSRDKYNTEMYRTLVDYNDRNNAPLSNEKIGEAIQKFIEED